MLIRNAEIYQRGKADLRIIDGLIAEMGSLPPKQGEQILDANGGALLPGLNDHHIHFLGYAASLASIDCSPRAVTDRNGLINLLKKQTSGDTWLRGFNYHESVAGEIDRAWLDQYAPNRPVRIQHRSGRLWILNSRALELVTSRLKDDRHNNKLNSEALKNGRFYDCDQTLSAIIGRRLPPVELASKTLASYGVTGFSDMTPSNDIETFQLFAKLQQQDIINQNICLASRDPLPDSRLFNGPVKIHLHENQLPDLDKLVERIAASHSVHVPVAIHCVTEIELLFSLAALEEAGSIQGDRIEHASVTPEHAIERIKDMSLTVVTQPGFVAEKGDTYLRDIEPETHNQLYRCDSFLKQEIGLAASSDAPFGSADPWLSMRAAVSRRTSTGSFIGQNEAVTPEQALAMYLGSLSVPQSPRLLTVGCEADLCLLALPWNEIRTRLVSTDVLHVFRRGKTVYKRDNGSPG